MKKLIVLAVMIAGFATANAQTKIAYISTQELISVMPEAEKADKELEDYKTSLGQNGQDLEKNANDMAEAFIRDSAKFTPSMKEIKRKEVIDAVTKAQNWNQTAQDMYNQKAQTLLAPIRTKALGAIKDVAAAKGYGYVIDNSDGSLLVMPQGDDLLPSVKTKLGIKDAPVKPNTGIKPTN